MNPIMFHIFNLEIRWYSFFILVGVILAIWLIEREAKRFKIDKEVMFNLCFYTIILGIVGARLYYVLFNDYNFLEIFKIWNGGLAIHGGIIAGLITILVYTHIKKLDVARVLDIIVPALILAQALGRWGNFFNGEAHGFATTYSFLKNLHIPEFIIQGMRVSDTSGLYYLPTFYLESLWCFLGLIVLIIIRRLKYIKVGMISSIYLMWYGIGRFFIEAWRTDALMFFGFRVAQIISILMFLSGLIYMFYLLKKGKYTNLYNKI